MLWKSLIRRVLEIQLINTSHKLIVTIFQLFILLSIGGHVLVCPFRHTDHRCGTVYSLCSYRHGCWTDFPPSWLPGSADRTDTRSWTPSKYRDWNICYSAKSSGTFDNLCQQIFTVEEHLIFLIVDLTRSESAAKIRSHPFAFTWARRSRSAWKRGTTKRDRQTLVVAICDGFPTDSDRCWINRITLRSYHFRFALHEQVKNPDSVIANINTIDLYLLFDLAFYEPCFLSEKSLAIWCLQPKYSVRSIASHSSFSECFHLILLFLYSSSRFWFLQQRQDFKKWA